MIGLERAHVIAFFVLAVIVLALDFVFYVVFDKNGRAQFQPQHHAAGHHAAGHHHAG